MTTEQQIIKSLESELRRLAPENTPWRTITIELAIDYKNEIQTEWRVYEGIDIRGGMRGKTLAEVEQSIKGFDPEAERLAKLLRLENEANELREQIRKDAEEKAAK